jgi:hypothetical protein
MYHLAKTVELVGQFQNSGLPNDVSEQLQFRFDKAIKYAELGRQYRIKSNITYASNHFRENDTQFCMDGC